MWSLFFFLMLRRPPRSTLTDTLFPSTTLFRSLAFRRSRLGVHLRVLLFVVRGGLMADVPEHGRIATAPAADAHGHSHHPIIVYLKVWGYLFVLSAMSYMVDYFHVQGVLRSEEHTYELQSLMRISYAVFCLKTTN